MDRPFRLTLFVIIFLLISALGYSFSFNPLSIDFTATGPGSIQTFRIENDTDNPIAVKISMQTREMSYSGEETNTDASDLFLIYPPQVYLEPGMYQAVRVQWTGPEVVKQEKAFRIIAEQLPVQTEIAGGSGGSINIMLKYRGAVYVLSENPKHRVEFFYAEPLIEDSGEKMLTIEVVNRGNSHVILHDLATTITSKDGDRVISTVTLDGDNLPGMIGENVLAGQVRRFVVPWPEGLDDGDLYAELSFRPVR